MSRLKIEVLAVMLFIGSMMCCLVEIGIWCCW